MQLVLSNNRIIAHGENFLAMGGTVISTVTGKKYDNATIAECEGCPADIDSVGYEYHGGTFVPCAPFGKADNTGYIMEVCTECATPRNSGVPIRNAMWKTIGTLTENGSATNGYLGSVSNAESVKTYTYTIPTDLESEELAEYMQYRVVLKKGSLLLSSASMDNYGPYVALGGIKISGINATAVDLPENFVLSRGYISRTYEVDNSSGDITFDVLTDNQPSLVVAYCSCKGELTFELQVRG